MSHQKRRDWRGAIIGMVMGDGSLYKGKASINYKLDITHCEKQIGYLAFKKEIVNQIFEYDIPITKKIITTNDKEYIAFKFATRIHSRLSFIAKNIYIGGQKRITDWVLQNITNEGLAYWWMDDGCLHWDKRNNHGGGQIIWSLYGFPKEDIERFRLFLIERFGCSLNLLQHCHGGYFLKKGISEGSKLLIPLKQYSVSCMDYKFDLHDHTRPYYNLKSICYSADHPIKDDDIVHPSSNRE
jgi:hypothetical protein